MDQNGVVSRLSVEKLLSHSAEKFRRVILYCCIFFPVAKKFGWEGEYQDFTSKIFCLTVRKTFVGEFFTVAIIAGTEKVWIGEGVSRFSVENFMSHSDEKFLRGILYCCINLGC